jgi:hypothetical protein
MVTNMKKQSRGVDALIYLFDHMIADQLNVEYNIYSAAIDSMTDDDSMFVMESIFDYILAIEDGFETDEIKADYEEACNIFFGQKSALESGKND